jgi:NAD(P)-dependent dehydrogenase (short-subunit alcohol dehydrogenase family)
MVCVVTGAGGGIGQGIAEAFTLAGAKVAVLDLNPAGIDASVDAIKAAGGQAIGVKCNVADPDSVARAAEQVEQSLGRCNVLVNNAGFIRYGRLEDLAPEDWSAMMDVNLRGYLVCAQVFGRQMLAAGSGAIVHVASIAASEPHELCSAYSASKAGVVALSQQMALEWGPRGVRSNCVSPGLIRTPLSEEFYAQPEIGETRRQAVPLRDIGTPSDIADAVLFLASSRARYICGSNLVVDGGLTQTAMLRVPRPKVV